LAHADLALRPEGTAMAGEPAISPRKVLIQIRKELEGRVKRRDRSYGRRLEDCRADGRVQTSRKAIRDWPRRKPHKPPKPPKLHTPSDQQKAMLGQQIGAVSR
jgi:hypothetical protein